MKRCLLFLYVVFASIGGPCPQNQPQTPIRATATASDEEHALGGTWRVVEFADLDKDGKWVYVFGGHLTGYVVYDPPGHVHIQIMKVPPLTPFAEANSD